MAAALVIVAAENLHFIRIDRQTFVHTHMRKHTHIHLYIQMYIHKYVDICIALVIFVKLFAIKMALSEAGFILCLLRQ